MDQADTKRDSSASDPGTSPPPQHPGRHAAGPLSQSDPDPEQAPSRTPIWLVILIVLVVIGFVALHLTGVVGPGTH
jgi:hypothetical protein